ncbi:conserved hypothetical protein [Pyrenophora tritici-repentis Pt-1C-BFP]|uniref:Glycosyltransferase family 25 protein n=1 Tax=Pyrenophora tritici-repentis (strain Pt-1C-BFP) TaxID=426418 RepID=B2WLZ6_PYRTR|nr:uncharacterized protein PTRG_11006 [Pyrenophora tritici-repentis Pt-1C-BFP]EDU44056.1 conserved hypothetical protein [Pyrenophora tritici-repentis Pt-1C-BFP]
MPRPRTLVVILSFITLASLFYCCCCCYCYADHYTNHAGHTSSTQPPAASLNPANSTLGFSTILALSPHHSPRRSSLLWAANLTDLDIVIPDLPDWSVGDIQAFKVKNGQSTISVGSAKAWLGHLQILKSFLASNHETALIIEDDTDFDIQIRHAQIPRLAEALHCLLGGKGNDYWPPPSTWDLLYPGHCDDAPSTAYLAHPYTTYTDPSVPSHQQMHPDTSSFLLSLNLPDQTRILHRAFWPLCTFAYAVNRRSAALILDTFAAEPEGGGSAFDVALLSACRDREWTCWSVAPEVFHHRQGVSEIGREDEVHVGVQGHLWVDEGEGVMGSRIKALVTRAIDQGECPIDALREEETWKSCEWGECFAQS